MACLIRVQDRLRSAVYLSARLVNLPVRTGNAKRRSKLSAATLGSLALRGKVGDKQDTRN